MMGSRSARKVPPLAIVALVLVLEICGMVAVQFSFGRNPFQPAELQMQDFARFNATNDRLVFAPYYYYYDAATGFHTTQGNGGALALQTYNNGSYETGFSWANQSWQAYEIYQMSLAKIDVCLPVYSGDSADSSWALGGLDNLVAAYSQLVASGIPIGTLPKIALYLNVSSLYQDEIAKQGNVDLMTMDNIERMVNAITTFYAHVPNEYRFMYHDDSNNYLVWFDNETSWVGNAKYEFLINVTTDFDAIIPNANMIYVGDQSWADVGVINMVGYCQSGTTFTGPTLPDRPGIKIASVSPGLAGRADSTFYNASWAFAETQQAQWVFIESWDNYNEGSAISPTAEFGNAYVGYTAANIAAFKAEPPSTTDVIVMANFAITDRMFFIAAMQFILGALVGVTLYLAFIKYNLHHVRPKNVEQLAPPANDAQ
jgi:hypothetical protein